MPGRGSGGLSRPNRCAKRWGTWPQSRVNFVKAATSPNGGFWSLPLWPRRHTFATRVGSDQVLQVKRLNLSDGEPFAVVTVWCPAELGHHLSQT